MYACPLLFMANKSLLRKKSEIKKILDNSYCLKEKCIWFDSNSSACVINKLPYKNYIKKTVGCIRN